MDNYLRIDGVFKQLAEYQNEHKGKYRLAVKYISLCNNFEIGSFTNYDDCVKAINQEFDRLVAKEILNATYICRTPKQRKVYTSVIHYLYSEFEIEFKIVKQEE